MYIVFDTRCTYRLFHKKLGWSELRKWKKNTFLLKNVPREPSTRVEMKGLMSEGFTERKIKEKCEVPENLGFPSFSQKFNERDRGNEIEQRVIE